MVSTASFILMELPFYFSLYTVPSSVFFYPLNIIVSVLIVLFSLLGVRGLAAGSTIEIYFALLVSVWEILLGTLLIIQQNLVQGISSVMLGASSFSFGHLVFRSLRNNPQIASQRFSHVVPSNAQHAVELIDLEKKYFMGSMAVPAIDGINLEIRRGEFISIVGPSGCGKSTLLNLIGALDRPTSGKVSIDGMEISTLHSRSLARLRNEKIGFIFQAYNLINRSTVFRNVELPVMVKDSSREERTGKVREMLEVVELLDKASRKPKMLSGGEQQRVAIARALINRPSIVLADEPTGNLDSKTGKSIISFMRKLNRETGTTIVVVTHNREIAEATDRIIHLKDGKVVKEEKTEQYENEK